MEKIVTIAPVLPHGNSDVECGFSVNKDLIGETQTCLTIGSINGFRLHKDVVHQYGKPESVPLGKKLITAVATARVTYERRLQEERLQNKKEEADRGNKKREEEKHQKERQYLQEQSSTIKEKEVKFQKEEEMCKQEHEIGKQLIEDATDELIQGITENNMQLISETKLMIQMGNSKLTKLKKEMGSIRKHQKIIEEKKSIG